MIASVPQGAIDQVDETAINHFIHTSEVKRRGYDKSHLKDDV
jgi:hypothetical protein